MRNYIQIEIGGKLRGLKFNQYAMQEFSLNYQRHSVIAAKSIELFFIYNIFYSGLAGNCFAKSEDQNFAFEDVMEWIEEMYEEGKDAERDSVIKLFTETRIFKDAAKVVETESDQKKSTIQPTQNDTGITVSSLL